jgi:glycosyltransferase involved in cell wall biosynthesis
VTIIFTFAQVLVEVILIPFLAIFAVFSRFTSRNIDIGIGPYPLVPNIYIKSALQIYGYSAETFVAHANYITKQYDMSGDERFKWIPTRRLRLSFAYMSLFLLSLMRYKCLYLYFSGGPLGSSIILRWIEPFYFQLAGLKLVLMSFGGDIQVMTRSSTLLYRHTMAIDYPKDNLYRSKVVARIDMWTRHADHIISGCDWVYYIQHWNSLVLHFPIDTERWSPTPSTDIPVSTSRSMRILHAPNHRHIKGTEYFVTAVEQLKAEGVDVELVLVERVPNSEIRSIIADIDVIADQLVIGWYGVFAMEAMACGKPVLCYLHPPLEEFYVQVGLINTDEIPIVKCSPLTVKEALRDLALHREKLIEIGQRSRDYVVKHHSLAVVGKTLDVINRSVGVLPKGAENKIAAQPQPEKADR